MILQLETLLQQHNPLTILKMDFRSQEGNILKRESGLSATEIRKEIINYLNSQNQQIPTNAIKKQKKVLLLLFKKT